MSSSSPAASFSLSERLQTVTEHLAAARTPQDVFGVVLTPALEALNAVAGAVLLVDETGERLEIAATQGYEEGAQTLWQDGPLDGNVPAGDALKQHEPLFFEEQGDLTRAYPELEARTGGVAAVATSVLPMFLENWPLGAIILDFKEPHEFTPEEVRFLRILAAQCALALGRVQATRRLEQRVEERTRELEAERDFLRTLLGSLGESIVACGKGGRLTLFNGVARDLHGLDAEPIPPGAWAEHYGLYQPDGVTPLAPAQVPLYRAWQGQRVENIEMVVRHPSGEARTLLVNGQPILSERGERLGAVVAQRDITGRQEQARDLAAARTRAEVLAALGDALQQAASPEEVARLALDRIGPAVGACGLLVVRLQGEGLHLPTVWGDVPEAVTAYLNRPGRILGDTTTFGRVVQSGQAVYLDSYRPRRGVPPAFPAQAAGVEPIRSPDGTLVGFLLASRPAEAGVWQDGERDLLRRAAATLGLALERAEAARELEEERAALDAFVAYKEAVGGESDVPALARQAVQVVRANLEQVSVAYYEREGDLWKARVWSDDVAPEVVAQMTAGVSPDAPNFAEAACSQRPVFVEGWNAAANGLPGATSYGAAAFLPLVVHGQTHSLFAVGLQDARGWQEREKALVRAVARGLGVTLERTAITRALQDQNAELEARAQALEGFAHLTRDLAAQDDPLVFVRRAQEVVLSLLPPGYALYYERDGEHWRNRVQVGDVGDAGLQAFIDAGPRVGVTPSVDLPWTTGEPAYQDRYAQGSDTPAELVQHVSTVASLPVLRHGEVVGVFIAVVFEERAWTRTDRVVLETVVGSLGLALERAEGVTLLAQRTHELERSNAELEQFAYIDSHDLQAPIRAVTSFAGVIDKRYGGQLDERGRLYLRQIVDSGEHMKRLVDDLLAFSRVHTQRGELRPVDTGAVFDAVARRLQPAGQQAGASLTREDLPLVLADAQQLDQLFQNLISNGLKYHRPGVAPHVHVWAERDGELWRFAVQDNGIGIEPQYFDRIFVIFQRLHGREQYEGTGIGLAVCKKIVERHGGRLWLESRVGEGTTFFFTLPGA